MHNQHPTFEEALHGLKRLQVRFFSKEDRSELVRTCAPLDYGPSRRAKDQSPRYHFWDFDSDKSSHVLSLPTEQIVSMRVIEESFSPSELITWNVKASPWFLERKWGDFS